MSRLLRLLPCCRRVLVIGLLLAGAGCQSLDFPWDSSQRVPDQWEPATPRTSDKT